MRIFYALRLIEYPVGLDNQFPDPPVDRIDPLLLERGDSAGFSRLDSRIKELFPEKSEFTLEVLADQVSRGAESASSAVAFLQALLSSNHYSQVAQLECPATQRKISPEQGNTLNFISRPCGGHLPH